LGNRISPHLKGVRLVGPRSLAYREDEQDRPSACRKNRDKLKQKGPKDMEIDLRRETEPSTFGRKKKENEGPVLFLDSKNVRDGMHSRALKSKAKNGGEVRIRRRRLEGGANQTPDRRRSLAASVGTMERGGGRHRNSPPEQSNEESPAAGICDR